MNGARRIVAVLAVLVVAVALAVLLLGGGSDYTVKLRLDNASQLVKGNLVQVAGATVGKVKQIGLTPDSQAIVTISVSGDYSPLKQGTQAVVRQASLSGVANRYIDLQQGPMDAKAIPNGATLPASSTESAVDLDQLFGIFDPKVRADGRTVIKGFADMTDGHTQAANDAIHYLNPILSSSSRLFSELDRNDPLLERFVVQTSRLVTDAAAKQDDLAGLVSNFGQVSTALANQDTNLASAIHQLPEFLRKSNSTFVNLRATLDDLDPLVSASKPVVRKLRPLLADLRPFARDARPTFRDLARTIQRPGKGNDLVELLKAQPNLAKAALDKRQVNGATRRGAFPELVDSLTKSAPELAFFRPYAPELTGWFDDFSTSGDYDALGSFSRAGLALSAFTFTPAGNLVPIPPALRDDVLAAGAKLGRNNRCPGSNERDPGDGSTTYKPTADFNCDASIKPVGP
ncbi:MAG: phospholipid/cholesterol/gamma-HCH transport system substrate-binding protein [Solirubrobacteraceae bacterium]|nr:phospholipid/cholesterol/gamma-HCH transport system substrate-binding protein [Solirubrobacteraceae bacterium]